MKKLQRMVKQPQHTVIERAKQYFADKLTLTEEAPCCLRFEGAGGFIQITATELDEKKTDVMVESRQWDHDAEQFILSLA